MCHFFNRKTTYINKNPNKNKDTIQVIHPQLTSYLKDEKIQKKINKYKKTRPTNYQQ